LGKASPLMLWPELVVTCNPLDHINGEWSFNKNSLQQSLERSSYSDRNNASLSFASTMTLTVTMLHLRLLRN
jgi:hypothetical protein